MTGRWRDLTGLGCALALGACAARPRAPEPIPPRPAASPVADAAATHAWFLRAAAAHAAGDAAEAERATRWVERLAGDAAAWQAAGALRARQGDHAAARAHHLEATRLDPQRAGAWLGAADAAWALGQPSEAWDALRRAEALGVDGGARAVAWAAAGGEHDAAAAALRRWAERSAGRAARREQAAWARRLGVPEAAAWACAAEECAAF